MAILITGAGLVGTLAAGRIISERGEMPIMYDQAYSLANVAERLPVDKMTLVEGDINDASKLQDVIQRHGITDIIHTAGMLTPAVRQRPLIGVQVNLTGTATVLEIARSTGVRRVVFC